MKRGKRGQFYIMAAIIIVIIIASIAGLSNYARIKKEPVKFYSLSEMADEEGWQVMANSIFQEMSNQNAEVDESMKRFLDLFAQYANQNTQEDISLIFIYGDASQGEVSGEVYSRTSQGDVNVFVGDQKINIGMSKKIVSDETLDSFKVSGSGDERTINVSINGINQTIPLLSGNNFLFIMTTSSGLNEYVTNNFNNPGV
jgi:hypothetical protein